MTDISYEPYGEEQSEPQPLPRKRWSRKRKIIAGVASAAVLAAAGTAIALLLLRAPVTGGGTIVVPTGLKFTAVSVTGHTGTIDCTAALTQPDASIRLDNAVGGATCDLAFTVQRTGLDQDMRIQNFKFSTVTDEGFTGVMNTNGCRASVPLTPDTLVVPVKITVPTSAAAGSFSAEADAGMFAVTVADYVDSACPRA